MAEQEQVARVTVKVTVEMAHEQVLKLQCEYHRAVASMYYHLAAGGIYAALSNGAEAIRLRRQRKRIARWL